MNWENLLDTVLKTLEGWLESAAALLPNAAVAIVVILLGYAASKIVGAIVKRSLERVSDNHQATNLITQLTRLAVLGAAMFAALGILQLDGTVKSLLAGVGVIGLALGFAFQDIAANFVSGVVLAFRRQFNRGDLIEAAGFFGIVEDVSLRVTIGRTFQGQRVIIPNKDVFNSKITNYHATGERRIDLEVGVSYGDDLQKAQKLAIEAASSIDGRLEGKKVEAFYSGFGSSSIDMVVRVWVNPTQRDFIAARSDVVMAIKRKFDENDITIPFPIRTLDFGVPGGLPLGEVLPKVMSGRNGTPQSAEN